MIDYRQQVCGIYLSAADRFLLCRDGYKLHKKLGNICAAYAFEMIGLSFGSDLTWHYQKSRRLTLLEKQKNTLCLLYEGQWKEGG